MMMSWRTSIAQLSYNTNMVNLRKTVSAASCVQLSLRSVQSHCISDECVVSKAPVEICSKLRAEIWSKTATNS